MPWASIVLVPPGAARRGESDAGLSKQGRLDAVQMGELLADTNCTLIVGGRRRAVEETVVILADCCWLETSIDTRLDVTAADGLAEALAALSEAHATVVPRCVVVCAPLVETWHDLAARHVQIGGACVRYLHPGGWSVEAAAGDSAPSNRREDTL